MGTKEVSHKTRTRRGKNVIVLCQSSADPFDAYEKEHKREAQTLRLGVKDSIRRLEYKHSQDDCLDESRE